MPNHSLEEVIISVGISPKSREADEIRRKYRFLSSIDNSNFSFLLERLRREYSQDSSARVLSNDRKSEPVQKKVTEGTKEQEASRVTTYEILIYEEALRYVEDKAEDLNSAMLVANVHPHREDGEMFFYSTKSLDAEIQIAKKKGFYKKTSYIRP